MRLKQLTILNFKSIRKLKVRIKDLQVIIGPNGSGKTNFIEFFKFMRSLVQEKMVPYNPLAYWWGFENIVYNFNRESSIVAKFTFQKSKYVINYEVILGLSTVNNVFSVIEEKLTVEGFYSFKRMNNYVEIKQNKEIIQIVKDGNIENDVLHPNFFDKIKSSYSFKISDRGQPFSLLKFSSGGTGYYTDKFQLMELNIDYSNQDFDKIILVSPRISENNQYDKAFESLSIFDLQIQIRKFFQNITILRHPNLSQIRKPVEIQNSVMMDEDGSNMCEILYRWYLQKRTHLNNITDDLRIAFPGSSIGFEITQDNRVFMIVHHNNLKLKPVNISDGFFKLLFILTALETKPSLLLIDEIDNSLYKETLELAIDAIREMNLPTFITTHSPIVIDQVDLKQLLICSLTSENGTEFVKPNNITHLKNRLAELKVSWSDAWFTGQLTTK